MFFPPCFQSESEITIWGPASPEASLEERVARYISAPLSPVEIRRAALRRLLPRHPGQRVGDRPRPDPRRGGHPPRPHPRLPDHRRRTPVAYIPDHEPGLGAPLETLEPEWISGFDLARDADLLIHDCQYTDEEYPEHVGWGHSRLTDTLTFARRVEAKRLMLFHHDPLHSDDFLDSFFGTATERWEELGGDPAASRWPPSGARSRSRGRRRAGPGAGS